MSSLPRPPTPRRSFNLRNHYAHLEMFCSISRVLLSVVTFIYSFVGNNGVFISLILSIMIFLVLYLLWHWLKTSLNRPHYPKPPQPPKH